MTDQSPSNGDLADPSVTANLYCAGQLDEALSRCIVPLRHSLSELAGGSPHSLWLVRYARRGEHLKIRIHAAAPLGEAIRDLLAESCRRFLEGIATSPPAERLTRSKAVPIDAEDHGAEDHPDRSFLFTTYSPSHVSLGGKPFLDQPDYRAAVCRGLAEGAERTLATLAGRDGPLAFGQRLRVLLEAMLEGLSGLGYSRQEGALYLQYHRDWLVRFPLLKAQADAALATASLARYEAQVGKLAGLSEGLLATIRQRWGADGAPAVGASRASEAGGAGRRGGWESAVAALAAYTERFEAEPDYLLDPFAPRIAFPALFKVFHGLANQIGLMQPQEALAHHLLLRAVAGDETPMEVQVTPP